MVRQSSQSLFAVCIKLQKPSALPVIGIGGIATIDDVMEFLVAGATAVQIGTANFYNPTATMQLLDALPTALAQANSNVRGRCRRNIEDVLYGLMPFDRPVKPRAAIATSTIN